MNMLADQLTEQFYFWERRGRGWQVWDRPVELEPPFEPFHFYLPQSRPVFDDGRKPTFLSRLIDSFKGESRSSAHSGEEQENEPWGSYITPAPFSDSSPLSELTVALPPDERVTVDQNEQFLLALSSCLYPMSFEVLGTHEDITLQLACREGDLTTVEGALKGYFPSVSIARRTDNPLGHLTPDNTVVVDFGLSEEFMRPLRTVISFEPDPLIGLLSPLEGLRTGETGLLQVLFQSTGYPWTQSILRSVSDGEGGSFFADAPEMLALAREKTKHPLFAVVLRAAGVSDSSERAWDIVRLIAGGLIQLTNPHSNELIPLTDDYYSPDRHVQDVWRRTNHRSGMLLNSRELATLVHPPSASVQSPKLRRYFTKTRPAPVTVQGHDYVLGENAHRGEITNVSLETRQRLNHMHMIGATGTGKSTLLHNLIVQDIEQGNGLAVIDPHGDLIERVISCIPGRRFKDVVLFDPSDSENPLGVNILSAKSEAEKNVAASDLVAVFRRMSTSWGDQMTVVLGNAIQAFLESDRGGTLLDLRKFLLEEDFRKTFLRTVNDQEIRYFWEKQHHILRGNTLGSILTRLDTFLRPKIIRKVVAPKIDLQFDELMNQRKILLVKLAQGLMGEENSTLLGTLIVSILHQGAMARQALQAKERTPFFLYIDEFQNFITPSLAGVLSGTRKYGLGLILAHQDLRQIFNQDTGVANSVISNPGTRICFRVGDFDAQKLQEGFGHFVTQDLQNLGLGEAIARVERSDDDFNLKISPPRIVNADTAKSRRKRIIELSHQRDLSRVLMSEEKTGRNAGEETNSIEAKGLASDAGLNDATHQIQAETRERQPVAKPSEPIIQTPPIEDKSLSQHRYLQTLIKRLAESSGYKADAEAPTKDGQGRVDVCLTKDGLRIAVEISVSTNEVHELKNIKKCFGDGYDKVIVCCVDKRRSDKIRALAKEELEESFQGRLAICQPEDIVTLFQAEDEGKTNVQEKPETKFVKGYRVKVKYQEPSDQTMRQRQVTNVVAKSIQRMRQKE